jgi:hypothetical protein
MQDDFLESLVQSNFDAFVADLKSGAQGELEKSLKETRLAEDVDHQIDTFFEDLEFRAAGGRAGPAPRLRSGRSEPEPEWRPGMDPDSGLEKDGGELHKRFGGKMREPARIEKSASGWISEYGEDGSLIRCYAAHVDREVFAKD